MEARLKLCYGMDMTSFSLPHIIQYKYLHGQVKKRIQYRQEKWKKKKKETPDAPGPDSSPSPSSMRNLSSVRHLIGGGIHELMSWMEIKFSLAQLFEDF